MSNKRPCNYPRIFGIYRQSRRKGCNKVFQLIEVIGEVKIVHTNFVKKILTTQFYELRIKAVNEYQIIMFAVDHLNFAECTEVACLNGFHKKSNKDYKKATKQAEKILKEYLKNK